jgi:hypothetical protein
MNVEIRRCSHLGAMIIARYAYQQQGASQLFISNFFAHKKAAYNSGFSGVVLA